MMDVTAASVGNMRKSRVKQLVTVQNEAKELFRKKNQDYGDAFATYGTVGILVRLGDKINRLQTITSRGINLVEDEKLRDTLIDLHNYAAMGIMLLDSGEDLSVDSGSSPSIDSIPYPTSLIVSPKPIEICDIVGSTGNKYVLKRFKDNDGQLVHTCSCPSYEYCDDTCKTCKHIKQFLCA